MRSGPCWSMERGKMATIKCVGCYDLLREEYRLKLDGKDIKRRAEVLVAYICPRFFDHPFALSSLLRPVKGVLEAVEMCPDRVGEHCILCEKKGVQVYGVECVFTCDKHHRAWGKWLNEHPGKRESIRPGRRLRKDRWIEGFREFIEDMRKAKKERENDGN